MRFLHRNVVDLGVGLNFGLFVLCFFCDGFGGNILREEPLKMAEKQGSTESGCIAAHSDPTGSSGGKNGPRIETRSKLLISKTGYELLLM